jgi:DNA-binding response OmpR family regulator
MASHVTESPPGINAWPGHTGLPRPLRPYLAPDREDAGAAPAARILVVEDDYFVSTYIETILSDAGFTLLGPVHAGEEAVRLALREKPDLVIMDVRLAGPMDGTTAAREIFEQVGVRSLFVTAHSDESTRARAAAARPLGWLEKPFNGVDLLRTVREALKDST